MRGVCTVACTVSPPNKITTIRAAVCRIIGVYVVVITDDKTGPVDSSIILIWQAHDRLIISSIMATICNMADISTAHHRNNSSHLRTDNIRSLDQHHHRMDNSGHDDQEQMVSS